MQHLSKPRASEEDIQPDPSSDAFQALYRGLPLPTFTWKWRDGDFVLSGYNDEAAQASGGKAADFVGQVARHIYADRPDILRDLHECLASRSRIRRQMFYSHPNLPGERRFDVTYVFVPPDEVVVHIIDITEWWTATKNAGVPAEYREPLSDRELDVLRLLPTSLTQRQIGNELHISYDTVKTHTKAIYRKLGVVSRQSAVERARNLGLV
jgi:DNA-binding CsgD family transcriptional regulator